MEYNLDVLQPYEVFTFKATHVEFVAIQPRLDGGKLYAFGSLRGVTFAAEFDGLEAIFKWLVGSANTAAGTPMVCDGEVEQVLAYMTARCQDVVTRGDDVVQIIRAALHKLRHEDYFPGGAAEDAWKEHYG